MMEVVEKPEELVTIFKDDPVITETLINVQESNEEEKDFDKDSEKDSPEYSIGSESLTTTSKSESSDDEVEDMKFIEKLIKKHGIKEANEVLTSLLVPPHRRLSAKTTASSSSVPHVSGSSNDLTLESSEQKGFAEAAAPKPIFDKPVPEPIVQLYPKKLPETGQLVRRSKPSTSTTPIVRHPLSTYMSSANNNHLVSELSSIRTAARWVEAGQDSNNCINRMIAKNQAEQLAAANSIKPPAPKLSPPPKSVKKTRKSLISTPTLKVTASDSGDSSKEKIVSRRHRIKKKTSAPPSKRFKKVHNQLCDINESEKSLLSTEPKSSVEESDQGSEMKHLISKRSDSQSIEQSNSDSDVPEENVSHGRKYQELNQGDGLSKQRHNWKIRSWSAPIAVIVALSAVYSYYGSSESPRVTRDVSNNTTSLSVSTTTETPTSEPPFYLIIFFILGPPGGIWLYLWFRWVQKMKRAYRKIPLELQASVKAEAKQKSVKEEPVKEKSAIEMTPEEDPLAVEERGKEAQEDEAAMNEKRLAKAAKKLDEKTKWANAEKRFRRHENRKKEVIRRKAQKLEKRRREALKTSVKAKTIYTIDKKHKSYWKRRPDPAPVLVWKKDINKKKKEGGKMLHDEEPIWHKVPFNDLSPIPSLISYNSDDLRSANTDTDSTGLPLTQWQGSTCSDRTQRGDNERVLRHDEMWQGDQIDKKRQWQNIINSWATTNLEKLQGFKSAGHYKAYRNWIVRLKQRIADMEAKEEELRNEIAYNRTVDKWKAMLAENAEEIGVKKLAYKKSADEDAEYERKNTEILMKLKKARTPAQNVEKYISESYVDDPDREYCIVEIAYCSVDPIDNFILSYKHDKYEHLFRTHTSKYVHDWARMRFPVDSPYDFEYYDAGIIYPWGEHFEEILMENKYNNLLAVASAPMFPQASAIFWHMMFCNRVPMLVMLNQMVERTFQTVDPFFPLRPSEEKRFKYNWRREYIVKCLEIKTVYKKNGIERLLEITPVYDRQRGPPLLMVFIHMLDWPQEGLPLKWRHYVDLCERIKDMSTNNPVMLMSMHGCGRAATLACSLMAAILVPLEDDLGVHVLVHGARATKRSSMTCELQVYFWRMVSYELLFRWFPETRKYQTNMSVRDEIWEDAIVGYLTDYADYQDEFFELMYTWEYDRFDRHYFASRHMRKMLKMKRRLNLEKAQCYLYQAREAQEALDEHAPYRNGEIIRRKFLRAWDPPRDPNRKKRVYVKEDILKAPMECTQAKLGIYPLLCENRPTGMYRWIHPSKQEEIDKKGMPQPGNYKEFCHMTEANIAEWARRHKRQRLLNPKVILPQEEFANVKFLLANPDREEPEKKRASRWDKWIRPPRHHPRKYSEKTPPRECIPVPLSPCAQQAPLSGAQSKEPNPNPSQRSRIFTAPREPPDQSEPVPLLAKSPAKDFEAAPALPKASSPVASKVSEASKVALAAPPKGSNSSEE